MSATYTKFLDLLIPQALAEPLQQLQDSLDADAFAQVMKQLQGVSKQLEGVVQERIELNIHIDNLVIDQRKYVQRSERIASESTEHEQEMQNAESFFNEI